MSSNAILQTRLRPPRLPAGHLIRDALLDQVLGGMEGRLVLVVAGPGYGKSTLLAQAVEAADDPWVWVTVDARLADPGLFVAHIAAGLGKSFPGVGAGVQLLGPPEAQVASLANEIAQTIADDVIVFLDDVHHIAEGPAAGVVAHLLADLPANVHLVLAGRRAPEFPRGRLLAGGDLLQIGEESLALSATETAALLNGAGLELSADQVTALYRRTEGWPAGILIAARAGTALTGLLNEHPSAQLFDYFAEEIVERQPRHVQEFLVTTALPDRFNAELAISLTGMENTEAMIGRLLDEHLLLIRLGGDGDWYRYHPLLREYLLERLAALGPVEVAARQRQLGDTWASLGEISEAVASYLEAGDHEGAARALEPAAEQMVMSPQAPMLASWLGQLPAEAVEHRPGLILAEAALSFALGDYGTAFARFSAAIDQLIDLGQADRAATAIFFFLQASGAVSAGDTPLSTIRTQLDRLPRETEMLPFAEVALGALCAYQGKYEEGAATIAAAVALPAGRAPMTLAYAEVMRAAWIDHRQGRSAEALGVLERAISHVERRPADDPWANLPFVRAFRTMILIEHGRCDEAIDELARAVQASEQRGMGAAFALPSSAFRAWVYWSAPRWDDLQAELPRFKALLEQSPHGAGRAHFYAAGSARLAAHLGDATGFRSHLDELRSQLQVTCDYFGPLLLCDLVSSAIELGNRSLAADIAADARTYAQAMRAPWGMARAALLSSVAVGGVEVDPHLALALELSDEFEFDDLWTRVERGHSPLLLVRALTAGVGSPDTSERITLACGGEVLAEVLEGIAHAPIDVRSRLASMAETAPGATPIMLKPLAADPDVAVRNAAKRTIDRLRNRPRQAVEITTLGQLELRRAGVALPVSRLRPKVRALLAVLLTVEGWAHRDQILEWLWPDADPERALASFQTTLWALRRALEPDAERSDQQLVVSDGERYRLALTAKDRLDARSILEMAASPNGSLDALIEAASRYGGPFCPEWPYEPWAEARRAQIEQAYDDVLVRLGEGLVAAERAGEAIAPLRTLVARVPESERAHRALMQAYAGAGERALALRQFHACRALLRQRLGVEPSTETRGLYSSLL